MTIDLVIFCIHLSANGKTADYKLPPLASKKSTTSDIQKVVLQILNFI
jgi:hypothetical protein